MINTTQGEMDESLLITRTGEIDNENELTSTVEYCLRDCKGQAHRTGVPDAVGHFCSRHVHRSVHVKLKKNVTVEGVAASF